MNLPVSLGDVSPDLIELARACADTLKPAWDAVDDVVFKNQARVLDCFIAEKVSSAHFWPSTGYGYQDAERECLERLYARVFGGEAALVRLHWTSGTHVLRTALSALLEPGNHLLSVTGTPYETLWPVIGLGPYSDRPGSLSAVGVSYGETQCLTDFEAGKITKEGLEQALERAILPSTRVIFIQRSRGYSSRPSISMESLGAFMEIKQRRWPSILTLVDNCYCEFTGPAEPPALGVTVTAGSLIKNPGGGLAPSGGYVVGQKAWIERVAESLYAPGLSAEVGSNPYGYRDLYQGLFMAPKVVGEALKGACFAALFFERLGYRVDPGPFDRRHDIVQAIILESAENLRTFARSIQSESPVDSFATPEPWDMPGYSHQVIMAAGTFVQGSSIELSCDAPFVAPYTAYLQGGLTREHVMIACIRTAERLRRITSPHDRVR